MTRRCVRPGAALFAMAALVAAASLSRPVRAQQPPQFRSSVDVTSVDVTVVDNTGRPVRDLKPGDFTVRVNGSSRRVLTADWIPLTAPAGSTPTPVPEGYSSNENATGGRLILFAVDQPNINFEAGARIAPAVGTFMDRLEPSDRVAAVGLGQGGMATPFTSDHARVKAALSRMTGRDHHATSPFGSTVSMTEALEFSRNSPFALERATQRECAGLFGVDLDRCQTQIITDAMSVANQAEADALMTIKSLRALLDDLRTINAPKTVILVSGGFAMLDESAVNELGAIAAAARASIYVLNVDVTSADASDRYALTSAVGAFDDRITRRQSLEVLTSASRGSLFTVNDAGSIAFERIERELTGYYLLGVESEPADKDGKPHPVKVEVSRPGATVRSRRLLMAVEDDHIRLAPHAAVIAALNSPLLSPALPIRVATFSLQGPEAGKIQLLIHADIGTDYAATKRVALAYVIADANGRIVDSQVADPRLEPVMNGVPSPLQFSGGASLTPGEYTLKLAVAEGDRVGSVEHPVRAQLVDAPGARLSELMVGGPPSTVDFSHPTVGIRVSFGTVQGYAEAYGRDARRLNARYEIAPTADGETLLKADVPPQPAGDERTIFSQGLAVRQLPPGQYYLRLVLSDAGNTVKTLARPFEVGAPAVLMTSAEAIGVAAAISSDIYLPVTDLMLGRPFHRDDAVRGELVSKFRETVAESARPTFEKAVGQLAQADYLSAERGFKSVLESGDNNAAALAYLAATYAASGHDPEAASAWQTSLIDGSDFPQIYEWLGDTLLRAHQITEARAVLEEAVGKWPSDVRFALPLALVYATFGQGREAARALERHIAAHPDDHAAQSMGVQWLFQLHESGAFAHSAREDLQLAHAWGDSYLKAKGPETPLVRQWLQALESRP